LVVVVVIVVPGTAAEVPGSAAAHGGGGGGIHSLFSSRTDWGKGADWRGMLNDLGITWNLSYRVQVGSVRTRAFLLLLFFFFF
jgi:hypothetical protein